jgi:hypothetical protein
MACALIIVAVAAPTANAASFKGGSFKVDFKTLLSKTKATVAFKGQAAKTKSGGTFELGTGTLTMVAQSSGNLTVDGTTETITFTRKAKVNGKNKTFTLKLTDLTQKLTSGKGQIGAKVGGKGKVVYLFNQASTNKVKPSSDFVTLAMSSSKLTLTKAGASALNKGLGLAHDFALKGAAAQAAGTSSFSATRQLTIQSGNNSLIYDEAYYKKLSSTDEGCEIITSAVAPATPIPAGAGAPYGGVNLPVVAGAKVPADTLAGEYLHDGGVSLDRGPGNSQGAEYHTQLTKFKESTTVSPPKLEAFSSLTNNNLVVGSIGNAALSKQLSDTGGSITFTGILQLSNDAGAALSALSDPDGPNGPKKGCQIPPGTNIGTQSVTIDVL